MWWIACGTAVLATVIYALAEGRGQTLGPAQPRGVEKSIG
jgi:hypothetical protein